MFTRIAVFSTILIGSSWNFHSNPETPWGLKYVSWCTKFAKLAKFAKLNFKTFRNSKIQLREISRISRNIPNFANHETYFMPQGVVGLLWKFHDDPIKIVKNTAILVNFSEKFVFFAVFLGVKKWENSAAFWTVQKDNSLS